MRYLKILRVLLLTGFGWLGPLLTSSGATALWSNAANITGDLEVLNSGERIYAYRFAGSAATGTQVNGVAFDRVSPITASGVMSVLLDGGKLEFSTTDDEGDDGRLSAAALQAPASGRYTTLSAGYQALLGAVAYNAASNHGYEVHLHQLTVGQTYRVQVWANESRAPRGLGYTLIDGVRLDTNDTNAEGGLGQYLTGYFVADSVSQTLQIGRSQYLNAISLYAVPEPALLPVFGMMVAMFLWVSRRRRAKSS